MIRFISSHPGILGFGVLLTLFSSFGQTFLISIFVPDLLAAFGLGTGAFGMLYAGATLASAACLPFFGRLLDRVSPRRFALATGAGLAAACVLMAVAWHPAVLFLAIFGLRLTGQGLLGLTASTTMARAFDEGRGKALSVSSLGYPLGEGLLPLAIVLLIHAAGWRLSWLILAGVIACILLPATLRLARAGGLDRPAAGAAAAGNPASAGRPRLFRDPVFFLLLPANLLMPVVSTALFLYQIPLAASRGWEPETMARAFIGFAAVRALMSFVAGPWIDRFTALRVLQVQLAPAALGLAALAWGGGEWAAYAYLALVGVSQGIAGPVMTATWAEIYGVARLGAIKGTVVTLGVLGTAMGPLALGLALDAGATFDAVIVAAMISVVLVMGVTVVGCRYQARGMAA